MTHHNDAGQTDKAIVARTSGCCCICLQREDEEDEIQQCDGCGLEVHGKCYGDDEGEEDDHADVAEGGPILWFCESCKAGVPKPVCVMCPNEGGAFKQLDETGTSRNISPIHFLLFFLW